MNLFETSPVTKKKLYFGFAIVLFVAGAILFFLSKGAGLFRLSGLILLMVSMRVYRRVPSGLAQERRPEPPHLRRIKILGLGSLLAACAAYIFVMHSIATRSTAVWPVYLFLALSIIPGLCWIYITIAKWR